MLFMGGVIAEVESLEQSKLSKAVFFVHWYGVGKAALEGLPGVLDVTSGFKKFREINTVTYDPSVITPEQMISALKDAGTFIGVDQEKW